MATTTTSVATPRPPRHCFICFMDEGEAGGSTSDWVDPCPCTLEAHQDCMLDWITDLEREKKPVACPVCKSPIRVDGPWDPVLALSDVLKRGFGRVTPGLLLTGLGTGVAVGLGTYGLVAVRVFAGDQGLFHFLYRWGDGRWKVNAGHLFIAPWIAPALILNHTFPYISNVLFIPAASLYGVVHLAHDENFLAWPPSPQLAFAVFPTIQRLYHVALRELLGPWEKRMNRQLLGLADPDLGHQAEELEARGAVADDVVVHQAAANEDGLPDAPRLGLFQRLIDGLLGLLNVDNFQVQVAIGEAGHNAEPVDGLIELELIQHDHDIEEEGEGDEFQAPPDFQDVVEGDFPPPYVVGEEGAPGGATENATDDEIPALVAVVEPAPAVVPAPANAAPAPAPAVPAQPPQLNQPREQGLGEVIAPITNALATALLLPVVSAGIGEVLRLCLPRSWTTPTQFGAYRLRTGLFQERWARSLAGGCMYLVLRDMFRLYTKHRRVVNKPLRRVRNVDRRRNTAAAAPAAAPATAQ